MATEKTKQRRRPRGTLKAASGADDPEAKLTPKQIAGLESWLQGDAVGVIAGKCGVNRSAVTKWLRKPAWIAAAQKRRGELRAATEERVKHAVDVAWATLVTICQDTESHEGARVRAAAEILERAGWQPPTEGAQPADAIAKALNDERDQVCAAIEQAGGLGALLSEKPTMPDPIDIDPRGEVAKRDKRIAELEAELKRRPAGAR